MKAIKDVSDLSINITMSRDELKECILLGVMRYTEYTFLPYKVVDRLSTTQIPDKVNFRLEFVPKGGD